MFKPVLIKIFNYFWFKPRRSKTGSRIMALFYAFYNRKPVLNVDEDRRDIKSVLSWFDAPGSWLSSIQSAYVPVVLCGVITSAKITVIIKLLIVCASLKGRGGSHPDFVGQCEDFRIYFRFGGTTNG